LKARTLRITFYDHQHTLQDDVGLFPLHTRVARAPE
jgi:hypothetical protein